MSPDKAQNFRLKKKRQGIMKVQISFQMQKKNNVLASKLRLVKTFRGEKMVLCRGKGNGTTA